MISGFFHARMAKDDSSLDDLEWVAVPTSRPVDGSISQLERAKLKFGENPFIPIGELKKSALTCLNHSEYWDSQHIMKLVILSEFRSLHNFWFVSWRTRRNNAVPGIRSSSYEEGRQSSVSDHDEGSSASTRFHCSRVVSSFRCPNDRKSQEKESGTRSGVTPMSICHLDLDSEKNLIALLPPFAARLICERSPLC